MTSPFRPFRSRLVHQDRAAELVTPMVDAVDVPVQPPTLDDAAYDAPMEVFYVYRQCDERQHVGVVCDVRHQAFRDGRVRGHEAVQPDRVEALVRHFATAPARAELVALLHHAGPVFTRTVEEVVRTPPLLRFQGPDGLAQEVWRVPDADAGALAEELSRATHYIADGHHRVAATVEGWRGGPGVPGAGLPCVVHPMDGLALSAFHRRVPGPVDVERVLALLADGFEVRPADGPPEEAGLFGVYVDGTWHQARFVGVRREGRSGLDVAILHERLLDPLAGGGTVLPLRLPIEELTTACDGDDGLLVTLSAPTLDVLIGIADRGEVMPPKTTYFDPKPCAGIFLRD